VSAALFLAAALQSMTLNWDALPPLPYRAPPLVTGEMQNFVQREFKLRGCATGTPGALQVDVAVMVDESGGIRTAVPRAIDCPSIEQYAAALVAGFARNNLMPRHGAADQWYRATLTFPLAQ
jgi:hypothetical protein